MGSKLTKAQAMEGAARAHTTLSLFEVASSILESSDIRGDTAQDVAVKCVRWLRAEQGKLVLEYDRYTSAALSQSGEKP